MAWRRPLERSRIEPPEWYRNYHPESWNQPDAHELAMIDGSLGAMRWPECADGSPGWLEFHDAHARRRWAQARYEYEQANPEFATQVFNDIRARRAVRRAERAG